MLQKIISTIISPFKSSYAVKPTFETQDQYHPYKLYKVNFLGEPQPKVTGIDHKYAVEQAATELFRYLQHGHRVYILGDNKSSTIHNKRESDLLAALQQKAPDNISHSIILDAADLRGTRSSGKKYENYNEIVQLSPQEEATAA